MSILFTPTTINSMTVPNRFAMAPMTRQFSPNQTPTSDVVEYYRKRAAGGVGLIITEGTTLRSMESTMGETVPKIEAGLTVDDWKQVTQAVQAEGSKIACQVWHVGALRRPDQTKNADVGIQSPSGMRVPNKTIAEPLTDAQVQVVIDDYVQAAKACVEAGFDSIELHGAHGYLIDQFLWKGTNTRTDRWGGDLLGRAEFVLQIIKAVRKEVGPTYPLILRSSQWKQQEYTAKLVDTPEEMETLYGAIVNAGIDSMHCSSRRYWEPEFEGSDLNFAGWVKKLVGVHTITVGSVGLNEEFIATYTTDEAAETKTDHLEDLNNRVSNGEFDMVAVGRALISTPNWVNLAKAGQLDQAVPYTRTLLGALK